MVKKARLCVSALCYNQCTLSSKRSLQNQLLGKVGSCISSSSLKFQQSSSPARLMAYRGRGRGCGFQGGGGGFAKQEPFVCFPHAELPHIKGVTVGENLVRRSLKLHNYWKASPYYLEDTISKKGQSTEIERFSDRNKVGTTTRRDSLSQILEHRSSPAELTEGSKGWQRQPSRKRVRWNPDSEMQKLDIFEKLEQRQAQNDKGEKEKKEGENEDQDEGQENEESEEEPSDDDDYNQNVDFDDDEDDLNMDNDGEDEMTY